MEKNKLAVMYMEMRQEADIRSSLAEKYKIDLEEMADKKRKS